MIKNRDFWMPFAPSVVNDKKYLVNPKDVNMEYMMIATNFKNDFKNLFTGVSHPYDSSCRPNVVSENSNYYYYKLIQGTFLNGYFCYNLKFLYNNYLNR